MTDHPLWAPGRELLAIAPTGSGKTLAFLLPAVAALRAARNAGGAAWPEAPKALFLSPTHELAGQVGGRLPRQPAKGKPGGVRAARRPDT
jgi:superfamily II DNA/RNA helicase